MKFKNVFLSLILAVVLALSCSDMFVTAALFSTSNLSKYERNLDVLKDKEGSLLQLVGELQGLTVTVTSGSVQNTNILLPGIGTEDTIVGVVRYSSANILAASSATISYPLGDGTASSALTLQSKVWGIMGNNITVTFTQVSSQTAGNQGVLAVVTTGYAIEVKLSTGDTSVRYASGTAVCGAISGNAAANSLVSCVATSFATSTVLPLSTFNLANGSGSSLATGFIPASGSTITASGIVRISSTGVVGQEDVLQWFWFNRP